MKLGIKVKENLAKAIGSQFTTREIVSVFKALNIYTDETSSVKWLMTLDAFGKISDPETIPYILKEFCHPLNFPDPQTRHDFINKLNSILSYEDIQIQIDKKNVRIVSIDGGPQSDLSETPKEPRTSTDYIVDALEFFKREYNKAKLEGLTYDYSLGENSQSEQTNQDYDDYASKLNAIKRLKEAGFIKEFEVEERVENEGYYVWDYAVCKINEKMLTQKEAAPATQSGIEKVVQKVIKHEHTHEHNFKNSIQEKDLTLKHKYEKEKRASKPLKDYLISFNENASVIHLDETEIPLPEFRKEYYFCKAMFKRPKSEAVDWSVIFNEMDSKSSDNLPDKNHWRYVYDAHIDVNNRIKELLGTDEKLFVWSEKTVKRLH